MQVWKGFMGSLATCFQMIDEHGVALRVGFHIGDGFAHDCGLAVCFAQVRRDEQIARLFVLGGIKGSQAIKAARRFMRRRDCVRFWR